MSQIVEVPSAVSFNIYETELTPSPIVSQTFPAGSWSADHNFSKSMQGIIRFKVDFTNTASLAKDTQLWLEIELDGVVKGAREQIGQETWALFAEEAVYADIAGDADTLDGIDSTGLIQQGEPNSVIGTMIQDSTISNADLAAGSVTTAKIANAAVTAAKIVGGPGSGVDADMLDGVHAADLEESAEIDADIAAHTADVAAHHTRYSDAEAGATVGPHVSSVDGLAGGTIAGDVFITSDMISLGNVGIGSLTPSARLTVVGDVHITSGLVVEGTFSATGVDADMLDGIDSTGLIQQGEPNSVTGAMIQDSTITNADLAPDSVTSSEIVDGAVTAAKIAGGPGSGVDADMVDGLHAAEIASVGHNHDTRYYTETEVNTLVAGLQAQITALQVKLANMSVVGNTVIFSGVNVQVKSGSGATAGAVNGLGNLIVGYNESSGDDHSGSHNLIIGPYHSYASYGGLVAGYNNSIIGNFSSVSGGSNNTASSNYASVSGGNSNTASGSSSSVSGGRYNDAGGDWSSVSGGGGDAAAKGNTAFAHYSSVSAGENNLAGDPALIDHTIGSTSSVSGGYDNTASGQLSSVTAGRNNAASGWAASVSGGSTRSAVGSYDWAAGSLWEDQ